MGEVWVLPEEAVQATPGELALATEGHEVRQHLSDVDRSLPLGCLNDVELCAHNVSIIAGIGKCE